MDILGVRRGDSLDELLATSDIVSLHAPLSRETHHLIDAAALAKMKRGAYLSTPRAAPLVDEDALCDALESGHLRGAGLDVYEHEPEVNPRLLRDEERRHPAPHRLGDRGSAERHGADRGDERAPVSRRRGAAAPRGVIAPNPRRAICSQ